jgi:anthranilate phosphoribosyltransferase
MPFELKDALDLLLDGRDLSEEQAAQTLRALTDPDCHPAIAGAVLTALRCKGETAEEIRGLAAAMRRLARRPRLGTHEGLTDIVGTGGDGSGSLNLSTGTALLAAACGVPVVKHGNRSVSSKSGSADVLEVLGLRLPMEEEEAGRSLEETGFSFLFAPYYHPAMKSVAAVRGALRVRTVFNILGPLTNPAAPPFNLIGAYSPEMAELMAHTLAGMEIERAFVIHGDPGWDEATPVGPFLLFDVTPGAVERTVRDPAEWGLPRCSPEELAGGDAAYNAGRIEAVFQGRESGAHRDALTLGTALVLELTGRAQGPADAVQAASEALDGGAAAGLLEAIRRGGSAGGMQH